MNAAMRSVTGLLFRPSDLFDVEPAPATRARMAAQPYHARLEAVRVSGLQLGRRRLRIAVHRVRADIFAAYLQRRAYVRDAKGWLIGAIGNASSNYIRKRKPEAEPLPEHEEAIDAAAEESLDRWMRRLTIVAVLARLGTKCRETLRRYYLHEEPKERIAAHLLKEALVELRRYEWYVAAVLFLAGASLLIKRELSRRRLQREG